MKKIEKKQKKGNYVRKHLERKRKNKYKNKNAEKGRKAEKKEERKKSREKKNRIKAFLFKRKEFLSIFCIRKLAL